MLDRNGQKVTTRSFENVATICWSFIRLDEATKLSSFEGGQMCHCTCKDDDNSVSEDEGAIQVDGNVRNLSQKGDHLQEAERVLGHEGENSRSPITCHQNRLREESRFENGIEWR
ncbi:hypothetical protein V6N13_140304 [Hibiscus sabdariffa]